MMRFFLVSALSLIIFATGCQKKDKNPVRLRAIYNQPIFAELCLQAAQDEEKFSQFKSDPLFNLLCENLSYEEGLSALNAIERIAPKLLEKRDRLRENDRWGAPKVWDYGQWGSFSPTTLHYVELAAKITNTLGDVSGKHFVQIGAGYGGLCKIMHDLFLFESYTIIDFPPQLQLAQAYLKRFGIDNVHFYTLDALPSKTSYDCVLSDGNFSELSKEDQMRLIDRVFKQADVGFFVGMTMPQHFGVSPLSLDAIARALSKQNKNVSTHSFERGVYEFYWKTNL